MHHVVNYITNEQNVITTISDYGVLIKNPKRGYIAISYNTLQTLKDFGTGESFTHFAHNNGFENTEPNVTAEEIYTVIGLVPDWQLSKQTTSLVS